MRSACSMTIRAALGTSTPTSMTVVATKTFSPPEENRAITSAFSAAFMRPCTSPILSSGNAV
ncbi:ATP-dependent DNA helicase RecG domain protein [Neisseria meningitidis NM1476]|nr:ATP-dependent DNA helicase RecG domain protein [Neisseria meningitidis NM1476]